MTDSEYRKAKRSIPIPMFFKRKAFIVVMMLICSGIMAVAVTYAWFILSTAPEVSGITTTVGANGSLEIALLNNETGADTSLIQADVGDSISVVGALEGNITWGNLVDVSDAAYGLSSIVMYPAVLNATDDVLDLNAMLAIAHNGVDGRITSLSTNTRTSIYNGTAFTTKDANYGVRAVGSVGTGSTRAAYLASAKSAFQANGKSALAAAKNAVASYGQSLISAATGGSNATFTYDQLNSLKSMASELRNSLNYVMNAYKQAIIANAAASSSLSDAEFEQLRTGITAATGNALSNYASMYPTGVSAAQINALSASINNADVAIDVANNLLYLNYGTEDEEPAPPDTTYSYAQVAPILNKIADTSTLSMSSLQGTTLNLSASVGGGLITDVADYMGTYTAKVGTFNIQATTTNQSGNGNLSVIDLSDLEAPETTESDNNESTVTDFYGYVIDLAFRTNASGSDLLLQSEAIDRVYTDGAGATAGHGSGVTYTFPSEMTDTQVNAMLAAVRVVFFDPDTGEIFGYGKLGDVIIDRTQTSDEGNSVCTAVATLALDEGEVIIPLEMAVPKKLSALVYLDGTMLTNTSVVNGADSGTLLLNLQFASSADLNPMVDNDLKNSTGE